jgi:hypothetical protein
MPSSSFYYYLIIVLHLPRQPGLVDIKIGCPSWLTEALSWHYQDRSVVTFEPHRPFPHRPFVSASVNQHIDFKVKPTLLFFRRTLELFLETVGPAEPAVSEPATRFEPS